MTTELTPAQLGSDAGRFARLRADEYGYLDEHGHTYLDHTGAGLPSRSQLAAHAARISGDCFGNPHSDNPTSAASTELVERTRARVLRHLNADPAEYAAIFTPNATGACRLVGEAFPFRRGSRFVLPLDNHNSVNGLREFARAGRARVVHVPFTTPDLRIGDDAMAAALAGGSARAGRGAPLGRAGLLAYPAQSNFTGVRHPLEWIEAAHAHGYAVLLDAAAYLPTAALDLSEVKPDFVTVSWYKVFGYPTGVGCLVARRDALELLRRPWFSGGTIHVVSAQGGWHRMAEDESAFEDGTLNFLAVPDVATGLDHLDAIGLPAVSAHVTGLTGRLLDALRDLRHSNGAPLVRVYGPEDTDRRGGTIALNILDPDGHVVDERAVGRDSSARGISLRTGCFCNPGAGEEAFAISRRLLRGRRIGRMSGTLDDYLTRLGLPSGGAVRVSLGVPSSPEDLAVLLGFVEDTYRDRPASAAAVRLNPRLRC
ncbi:aminotransferase class V-fold PLP-dependent enzyme [Streptacidiphilus anmyonensis]|uniref:aminotransferase class V-fold PLP-dependent enzyme n=1 Tax=Streptacidiphilus anmyonensis TaxID=405782 RepID=UPI0005A92216|nr:aminotransferase class V-fold PLP-dependent enzyme [Streptacidiphilus anmyonensis]